jgi:hypothetical protein
MSAEVGPADEAAGEGEEAFVDVGASLVANEESASSVQPGEGALDHPAFASESGAVLGLAACDHRFDAPPPELLAVSFGVVAAVGDQPLGSAPGPADASSYRGDEIDERQQLGDVLLVAAG